MNIVNQNKYIVKYFIFFLLINSCVIIFLAGCENTELADYQAAVRRANDVLKKLDSLQTISLNSSENSENPEGEVQAIEDDNQEPAANADNVAASDNNTQQDESELIEEANRQQIRKLEDFIELCNQERAILQEALDILSKHSIESEDLADIHALLLDYYDRSIYSLDTLRNNLTLENMERKIRIYQEEQQRINRLYETYVEQFTEYCKDLGYENIGGY